MQDLLQNQKQNAGIYAAQVAPKKADKSLPNSPDATLVQKLKELFVPPPAATDEEIVLESIKNLLHGQESSRGNGRVRGRGSRGGARGNYQRAKPGGYNANVQCHYCKQTGHIQRRCPKKELILTISLQTRSLNPRQHLWATSVPKEQQSLQSRCGEFLQVQW